ncbi:DUF5694 domain-containing protein [Sphingomonas mesophila]|uniref:DUF5694 domain-containing protein n=1 Tax=Sphingomonas mesophila TaxID=2303576 RepID=UPI001F073C15|nr:DUF5694 domain-containing protein [Sphingomonas mesophila]
MLTIAAAGPATSGVPFDPRLEKGAIAGEPTKVLVLGSPHLSQLPPGFQPATLGPLLDRLSGWKPDIIAVENLSGHDCDVLLRYRETYGSAFDDYCWGTEEAEKATGLTVPRALAEIRKTLRAWPKEPSAAARRRLASLFLAANDRASAQVQWLRLPVAERRSGDGLSEPLVTILRRKPGRYNETIDIGSALAARLGLERVYLTDDHFSDSIAIDAPPEYGKAIQRVWESQGEPPLRAEFNRRSKSLASSADGLDLYRLVNRPDYQLAAIRSDMLAAAKDSSPERWGRHYLAWWEARNLRMVANIRAAAGTRPGSRVLAIVGSTHKPYFDAYFDMMQDMSVENVEPLLK